MDFNSFLKDIKCSVSRSPSDLLPLLLTPNQDWSQILIATQAISKPRCGRPVKNGDLCFKCLDCCTPDKFDHIFCEKCFRKGDHSGHRIKYRNETYGYCDCGDENYIQKKAFCQDHQEKQLDLKGLKHNIPKKFRKKLKIILTRIFREVIDLIEGFNRLNEKEWKAEEQTFIETHRLLTFFIEFISWIVEDNFCFSIFFGDLLLKKLHLIKTEPPPPFFYHICSDLKKVTFSTESKSPCQCSLLDLFFRFNGYFNEEITEKIIALIFKLSPHIPLRNSVVSLLKNYINFLLRETFRSNLLMGNEPEPINPNEVYYNYSLFLKFSLFINSNVPIVTTFFQENSGILLEKLKGLCSNFGKYEESSNSTKQCLDKLFHFYLIRSRKFKERVYEIAYNTNFFPEIIRMFISMKNLKMIHLEAKINILELTCEFFSFLKGVLKKAQEEDDNNRKKEFGKKLFLDVFKDLDECAEIEAHKMNNLVINKEFMDFAYNVQNLSNKIFSSFLGFFLNCFDYNFEQVGVFLEEILGKSQLDNFLGNIFEQVILALYLDFLIQNDKNENAMIVKQAEASIYSVSCTYFKACDIFSLKFLLLIGNSPFSLENLKKTINSVDEKTDKMNINDLSFFLEIMTYMIFDDISVVNMINRTHSANNQKHSEILFLKNKISFLLANIFHINPHFKYDELKKIVNINEDELEKYLFEIAGYNEKTKNYELNEKFQDKFDLFSLPECSIFFNEFSERLNSFTNHHKDLILLLGNYPELLLKERTELLFKPMMKKGFIDLVCEIFLNDKTEKKIEKKGELRISLKLLACFLEMAGLMNDFSIFIQIEAKLMTRVKSLLESNDNKELEKPLVFVLEKLQKVNIKQEKMIEKEKSVENLKKKQIEMKQKILADFSKKQKNFLEKNSETHNLHFQNESKEKQGKKEEESLLCNVCLQNTKDSDALSYICYINKDNIHALLRNSMNKTENKDNILDLIGNSMNKSENKDNNQALIGNLMNKGENKYNIQALFGKSTRKKENKDNSQNLIGDSMKKSEDVSFYLHNCGHLIHKKCQAQLLKFQNHNISNEIFTLNSEFLCPYCKSFSNVLVPIVEDCYNLQDNFNDLLEIKKKNAANLSELTKDLDIFFIKCEKEKIFKSFVLKEKNSEAFFKDFLDDLCIATCLEVDSKEEIASLKFLDEILINHFESIYVRNLTAYFMNSRQLGGSLITIMLYYMSNNDNSKETQNKYKEKYLSDIKNLHNILNMKYFIGSIDHQVHLLLIKVLLRTFVLLSMDNKFRRETLQTIIKTFINQMFIITILALSEDTKISINFNKIQEFLYCPDLKSKVMGFLSPYYFLIIGILMTFYKPNEKSQLLIEKFLNSDHDIENSGLFKEFEALLAPDPIYLNFLCTNSNYELQSISNENLLNFKQNFLTSNRYEITWLHSINTYEDFVRMFISRTCEICGYYPRKPRSDLYLCLLCSKILCNGICQNDIMSQEEEKGNLTIHTCKSHEGNSVFINILKGYLLLFKMPKLIKLGSVFASKFGKEFNEYVFDFNNYFLDKALMMKITDAFFNRKYHQLFYHLNIMNQNNLLVPEWKNY